MADEALLEGRIRDFRPWIVPATLEELRGPASGLLELPHHIDWSPNRTYDLAKPGHVAVAYVAVLNEAGSSREISTLIEAGLLKRVWPLMVLPESCAATWEARHPELAGLRDAAR